MTNEDAEIKTYSLEEVASMVLPPEIKDGVRWLTQRLNRGEIAGYRMGRTWRMTRADIQDLIECHRTQPSRRADNPPLERDVRSGLTPTSRRRLERGRV
jgi:hypothetical protein